MNALQDLVQALGAVGPYDEMWGGLDPRLELSDRDRVVEPDPAPEVDARGRPAA